MCSLSDDSNDEDNAANDYPDEESSDDSLADSEDLDEVRFCKSSVACCVELPNSTRQHTLCLLLA